ncbi:uncharacterized protein LOC134842881 [Symsagittifera roscoffensis]
MVRLLDPIEKTKSILPICKELTPYTPCKERMGACGVGSISDNIKNLSKTLQETYFFESTMLSNSNPYDFRWCSLQNICVDSGIEGTSICHYDDGGPLYTFKSGTQKPECLYGVASYARSSGGVRCKGGSYFASVPFFHKWIEKMIEEY